MWVQKRTRLFETASLQDSGVAFGHTPAHHVRSLERISAIHREHVITLAVPAERHVGCHLGKAMLHKVLLDFLEG